MLSDDPDALAVAAMAGSDAPINVHWGRDNRTVGFRVPLSAPDSRRVENRVPGADANPYLALAASLACGYLGMTEGLKPTEPVTGSAHDMPYSLPRSLDEALARLRDCEPLLQILGEPFVAAYTIVKQAEHEVFLQVIRRYSRSGGGWPRPWSRRCCWRAADASQTPRRRPPRPRALHRPAPRRAGRRWTPRRS